MADSNMLLGAVTEFERMLNQSASLASENLDDRRREGIELRRSIAAQIASIRSYGEHAFNAAADREEFYRQFSKMRSAMALHQASWPIVAVDVENPRYHASVKSTRDANRDFIAWVRSHAGQASR